MNKTELRHHFLQKRLSLSKDDVDYLSQLICENFFKLEQIREKDFFHIFLPISHNKEINTWPLIECLWKNEKKVIVPITDFSNYQMSNYYLEKNTFLQENKYGIPEPIGAQNAKAQTIEVVVLPLLVFDQLGYRVGYGKGFYDRFLSCLSDTVVKIGLSFFDGVEAIDDVGEWDEKLDYCVTPEKNYAF